MTARSDAALASLLLTQRVVALDAPPFTAAAYWSLRRTVADVGALLGAGQAALVADGLPADVARKVVTRFDGATAVALAVEDLERRGIAVVTADDPEYPQRLCDRLGDAAPALLHVAGRTQLLREDGIGVVGSRAADADGLAVTRRIGHAVAAAGLVLISGGARGVDTEAMNAAWETGGNVVGVLPEGVGTRIGKAETRRAITDGRMCLCSPFAPDARFHVGNAMGRNRIVYALARTTVVVATDEGSGGTWEGATDALRHRYGDVAVWRGAGEGPGNAALVAAGGRAIRDVATALTRPPHSAPEAAQLKLTV